VRRHRCGDESRRRDRGGENPVDRLLL